MAGLKRTKLENDFYFEIECVFSERHLRQEPRRKFLKINVSWVVRTHLYNIMDNLYDEIADYTRILR